MTNDDEQRMQYIEAASVAPGLSLRWLLPRGRGAAASATA